VQLPRSTAYYENLLKDPLVSFRDDKTYQFESLKQHLQKAWHAEMQAKIKAKRSHSREEEEEGSNKFSKANSPALSSATESESS
jgi:hypothetical protein